MDTNLYSTFQSRADGWNDRGGPCDTASNPTCAQTSPSGSGISAAWLWGLGLLLAVLLVSGSDESERGRPAK